MSQSTASAAQGIHLVCGHCDCVVRIPADRLEQGPKCPKCHHALFDGQPLELSADAFDRHLARSDLPLIVDFWAPWCGPCRMMAPHFEEASRRLRTKARFAKVNSDHEPSLSARFGIRGIPTLIAFKQAAKSPGSPARWSSARCCAGCSPTCTNARPRRPRAASICSAHANSQGPRSDARCPQADFQLTPTDFLPSGARKLNEARQGFTSAHANLVGA